MPLPRPISLVVALLAFAAIYIAGLQVDVMDADASQYASISLEMLQNGEHLQVKHMGKEYLDKPPLLFWLMHAGWALFGVSEIWGRLVAPFPEQSPAGACPCLRCFRVHPRAPVPAWPRPPLTETLGNRPCAHCFY